MIFASIRAFGRAIRAFSGGASAHEIALGVALGVLLGLLPKTNLTAVLLCGLILALRLNLPAAAMAVVVTTPLASLLDGIAASLGLMLLSFSPLAGIWSSVFQQPIVPWLQLHDAIVLGDLTIGLLLAWPVYAIARSAVLHATSAARRSLPRLVNRSTLVNAPSLSERRVA